MILDEQAYIQHYGILRKSGRYPWGSGGTQEERNQTFLSTIEGLRKEGMSDTEIAKSFDLTTTQFRAVRTIAKTEQKQANIAMAQRLKDKGYSNVAIGERMGMPEPSVRALLAPGQKDRADVLQSTATMLKEQVAKKEFIDIGAGVENNLSISKEKLGAAVAILKEQGYEVHTVQVDQQGTGSGKKTSVKVLAPPGTKYVDIVTNLDKISQISDFSTDGGRSFIDAEAHPPLTISAKRVAIRYAEQGGTASDGVIYVRPGVPDISLGAAKYAQVRIGVDDSHYLKGMAVYKDDLPDGVDLMFNTNKSNTGNKLDAMKPVKRNKDGTIDPDLPFGSVVRPLTDPKTGKPISVMNILNEEGDWSKWSTTFSSQFLSKQSPVLAKTQLNVTFERKQEELDTILSLTNPSVRKKLLEGFADAADSSAVHLKAAGLPRTSTHVILPIESMKENEIYAPNFRNGERVTLVRHPHGGVFEIPELTVNNNNPEAKRIIGRSPKADAVGIHSKVAERLSGADFDGDTVLVIPNNNKEVKTSPALAGLKGFDPKTSYPKYEGMKPMTARAKAFEMGDVSNLITDMTIKGANSTELARAVRHSMVVIDAEKHELNYKQSAIDNGIKQLKTKYQGKSNAGAATLVSRASSIATINARKPRSAAKGGSIDKATGKKVFEETGDSWIDAKGKTVFKKERSTKLAEASDAFTLSSGTPIEKVYAEHSNKLKALADKARLAMVSTKGIPYSESAKAAYSNEVASLNAKLNVALKNAPLERQAQLVANSIIIQKKNANPGMEDADLKKIKAQALTTARNRTGAKKERIEITDSEWAAIQAGAISNHKLDQILNNADLDSVKKLATPKTSIKMTSAKQERARAMVASGYTQAQIADALGVSLTTLKTSLSE